MVWAWAKRDRLCPYRMIPDRNDMEPRYSLERWLLPMTRRFPMMMVSRFDYISSKTDDARWRALQPKNTFPPLSKPRKRKTTQRYRPRMRG